eukprot:CAMPEP_0197191640 /NCGR_PEP_ID=MMETSP1423-20130617/23740_1 /TAXON_ID=476441 /ORGANISM="Pseudo-nitzschia heimii, Strain UNC1101" /LENGTH=298 /DNA_ID=CAMNT_0042644337 /DNA_START=10 /DNA_END=906 /DNA_ORIENTATION=-
MARKSKQPGGHNPLTAHERKKYARGAYGTTTARLGRDSQYTFASCGLSLYPARDRPVATPSGYIYERSAMLEYMLIKTQELKKQQHEYDDHVSQQLANRGKNEEKKRKDRVEEFENSQKIVSSKKKRTDTNALKRTSYWLADMQPENDDGNKESSSTSMQRTPPPKRPPSPNTQRPLRRKDLIDLALKRSRPNDKKQEGSSGDVRGNCNHVLCAISEKEISTQQAIALVTKGNDEENPAHVILEEVYKDLKIDKDRVPICPVTGRKIKQVLKLRRGGSSFASNDGRSVEAKKYRPTMT